MNSAHLQTAFFLHHFTTKINTCISSANTYDVKLSFIQNCYTFTSILLIKIILCSGFSCTKFVTPKCFDMKLGNENYHRNLAAKLLHNWVVVVKETHLSSNFRCRMSPSIGSKISSHLQGECLMAHNRDTKSGFT